MHIKSRFKKLKIFLALISLMFFISVNADVHVRGYYRKDGTYVQPHYRSSSNSTKSDNWSTKGNYNPYTGEEGHKKLEEDDNAIIRYKPSKDYKNMPAPGIEDKNNHNEDIMKAAHIKIPNVTLIGFYGESKVGLFNMDDDLCFMLISGTNEQNEKSSIVIWIPAYPERFFVFPFEIEVEKAMSILTDYANSGRELKLSKSFLVINDVMYELKGEKSVKGRFPILETVVKNNPIAAFVDGEFFVIQFKDPGNPMGYRTNRYGLDGFSEALAAYHTFCKKK